MFQLAADTGTTTGGLGMFGSLWPILLMFVVLYFLLIRPQQKRQKNRNTLLRSLSKGDKVVTIGGVHGRIVEITDDTVVLLVNDSTKMTFERSAINTVTTQSAATAPAADSAENKEA